MSRIDQLRKELKRLDQTFPEAHSRLSIKAPSLDELHVHFKGNFGTQLIIITQLIKLNVSHQRAIGITL